MNSCRSGPREIRWSKLAKSLLPLGAILLSPAANTQELPCGIRDFRIEGTALKVFFSEEADWRVGSRGDRLIAGGKNLYFDEMQQDDVVVEEEALTLSDGASVQLSIPHIGCTLTAVLEQPVPGLSARKSSRLPGMAGTTDSIFLPAASRP